METLVSSRPVLQSRTRPQLGIEYRISQLSDRFMQASDRAGACHRTYLQLKQRLESQGAMMSTAEFAQLQAEVAQAQLAYEEAAKQATDAQCQLEAERQAEVTKMNIQVAKNEYDATLARFTQCRTTLLQAEAQIKTLTETIKLSAAQHSQLLTELHEKKTRLKSLGIEINPSC